MGKNWDTIPNQSPKIAVLLQRISEMKFVAFLFINPQKFWGLVRTENGRSNQSQAQNFCTMKKKRNHLRLTPEEIQQKIQQMGLQLCEGVVPRQGRAKLYCSIQGLFFTHSRRGLNQIKPFVTKNFRYKPNVHSNYPRLCAFVGNPYCHLLVAKAWLGPKPGANYVLDHINGNILDCRVENLQWVTVDENVKRARLLRVLRSIGRDPRKMSREELLEIFSKYTFTNPKNLD